MIHRHLSQRTEEGQSLEAVHVWVGASQDQEKILFAITVVRKDITRTNVSNIRRTRKREKKWSLMWTKMAM